MNAYDPEWIKSAAASKKEEADWRYPTAVLMPGLSHSETALSQPQIPALEQMHQRVSVLNDRLVEITTSVEGFLARAIGDGTGKAVAQAQAPEPIGDVARVLLGLDRANARAELLGIHIRQLNRIA